MSEYLVAFNSFDLDHDGIITLDEFASVMKEADIESNPIMLLGVMKEMDLDGNGVLTFDEFVEVVSKGEQETDPTVGLRRTFDALDDDKDGHITVTELKKALDNFGIASDLSEIEELIKEHDKNNDSMLSFEEFKSIANKV